jgi:hypothetical protein
MKNSIQVRLDRSADVLAMMEWFAGKDVRVLPIHGVVDGRCTCGNAECESPGKHPISSLVHNGVKGATTEVRKIRAWHRRHPDMNYAVAIHGIAVIIALLQVDSVNDRTRWPIPRATVNL